MNECLSQAVFHVRNKEGCFLPLQVLPLNRIKRLMKEEADVKAVAADASYAAARATVRTINSYAWLV